MKRNWTADIIKKNLEENQKWVERSLAVLSEHPDAVLAYAQSGKLQESTTQKDNSSISNMARWLEKGNTLTGKFVDWGRKLCTRYVDVLVDVANEKERTASSTNLSRGIPAMLEKPLSEYTERELAQYEADMEMRAAGIPGY
jgi:hypothetical protein